jgi:hypothetical protein
MSPRYLPLGRSATPADVSPTSATKGPPPRTGSRLPWRQPPNPTPCVQDPAARPTPATAGTRSRHMQPVDPGNPEPPAVRYDAQGRRLCSAHSVRTGDPMDTAGHERHEGLGMHGCGAPAAKHKARLRLLELSSTRRSPCSPGRRSTPSPRQTGFVLGSRFWTAQVTGGRASWTLPRPVPCSSNACSNYDRRRWRMT